VDARGELSSGEILIGPDDLKRYLIDQEGAIRRTLAIKMVAYFLGRAETVADSLLVNRVADELRQSPQLSRAILKIVQSPQFQKIRGRDLTSDLSTNGPSPP
jgi:hypothetical protein